MDRRPIVLPLAAGVVVGLTLGALGYYFLSDREPSSTTQVRLPAEGTARAILDAFLELMPADAIATTYAEDEAPPSAFTAGVRFGDSRRPDELVVALHQVFGCCETRGIGAFGEGEGPRVLVAHVVGDPRLLVQVVLLKLADGHEGSLYQASLFVWATD